MSIWSAVWGCDVLPHSLQVPCTFPSACTKASPTPGWMFVALAYAEPKMCFWAPYLQVSVLWIRAWHPDLKRISLGTPFKSKEVHLHKFVRLQSYEFLLSGDLLWVKMHTILRCKGKTSGTHHGAAQIDSGLEMQMVQDLRRRPLSCRFSAVTNFQLNMLVSFSRET